MANFFTILIIAITLSMDTFTLSMAYGMLNLNKKIILKLSIMVGIFHFFMPLIGNSLGELILTIIPFNSQLIIGIVFLSLAIQLLFSLFKDEQINNIDNIFSMLIFAFTVSLDSFSVGIGLNAISNHHIFASFIFMTVSFLFTYTGLKMGNKLSNLIGKKAQIVGIVLLLILSINYILKS